MSTQAENPIIAVPYTSFRFEVVLTIQDPPAGVTNPLCEAAFSECSGLDMSMDPKTVTSGGKNMQQFHLPDQVKYGRLSLKRGMTNNLHLWNWFTAAAHAPKKGDKAIRTNAEVTMFNSDGQAVISFKLSGCLPVKISAPALNAQSSQQVAVEELQLVYGQLKIGIPGSAGFGSVSSLSGASEANSGGTSVDTNPGQGRSVNGGPGLPNAPTGE